MDQEKLNFMFIMVDQMTAKALPFYGHPVVKTPNLSRLAEEGVVFENAYCNSPLCAPSRFSMMSGQLPSTIGAHDNAANFPADIPTFAHYLRNLGYYTCLSGKMHFVGADQQHGFEDRLTTDIYPGDYGWVPDWENFEKRPTWYHNMLSVVQSGQCETSNQIDFDEEVEFTSVRKIYDLARRQNDRPFLLLSSFTHPHDPFTITKEYWDRYDDSEIYLPEVPLMAYEKLDPHSQRIHHVCAMGDYKQHEHDVRDSRHAYYSMISYIDDKVGTLLKALENTGLRENTAIVFVSDHGEMLGNRGLWYKMSFFEWSCRIPMMFHFPKRFAAKRIKQPVSLVDILPTLTELASGKTQLEYAEPPEGRSLVPVLDGGDTLSDDPVYGEMLFETTIAPVLMIRDKRYKYIYCEKDPELLFDLESDPDELNNLASDPDFQEIRQCFYNQVMRKWDLEPLTEQVLASQKRRKVVDKALKTGRRTSWDFQPFDDASEKYMRSHMDLNVLERTARFPVPDVPPPDGIKVKKE
jgi:choline-sulfatase